MTSYVKICDVYQRIKVLKHKSYNELKFLFIFTKSWKEIIMNFVTNLSSSKRREVVYNSIFVIINRCIKMIKYILIITRIDAAELTKVFFKKIVLRFNMLINIISNKDSVFISAFWLIMLSCTHKTTIKYRISFANE